jgi:uncharacterized protein (DUF433 family)
VIAGARVLVSTIPGALAGGDSVEMVLEDYPNITREDIDAALEFASELTDFQEAACARSGGLQPPKEDG